jgi:guanine nucleotide-binding protein subunit gamma
MITVRSSVSPQRDSLSPPLLHQQNSLKQNPRTYIILDDSPKRRASRRAEQRFDSNAAIMSATLYEIRTDDNGRSWRQSVAELKLRRLTELNQRLQEYLSWRVPVSKAAVGYSHTHPPDRRKASQYVHHDTDASYLAYIRTRLLQLP